MARNKAPSARFDNNRIVTYLQLDIGELLATGVLGVLLPLITLGSSLPPLQKWFTAAAWPAWAVLLFFIRDRNGHNVAYWIAKMVPFWIRQRSFSVVRSSDRVTARHDLIDPVLSAGANPFSYAWEEGPDGLELHIYEEALRPYRGWIASPWTRGYPPALPPDGLLRAAAEEEQPA